jgi:hypothetical protein
MLAKRSNASLPLQPEVKTFLQHAFSCPNPVCSYKSSKSLKNELHTHFSKLPKFASAKISKKHRRVKAVLQPPPVEYQEALTAYP